MSKNNPNATQRQMDVDWSDWNGSSAAPEAPQSAPVERDCHKGGEHITKEDLRKDGEKIIAGAFTGAGRQPTNEELFAHLVRPAEDLEKMEKDWENFFNQSFEEVQKPVDDIVKSQLPPELQKEWTGGSYNDLLSEEEVEERGKYVGR